MTYLIAIVAATAVAALIIAILKALVVVTKNGYDGNDQSNFPKRADRLDK